MIENSADLVVYCFDIKPRDIVAWQNIMLQTCDDNGEPYSPVYLKTIHNQISAIFNHAVKFYELESNPAAKVGNMGKEKTHEMLFWTKAEYLQFAEAVMDKPISFYAFEVLYWCGLRLGELLKAILLYVKFTRPSIILYLVFVTLSLSEPLARMSQTPSTR